MNHKASAVCANGHKVEFGTCNVEVKKFFGGTKICNSKGYVEISANEVECSGCKSIISQKKCLTCGAILNVSDFERKGFYAKLG